jgi:hypothetical protein
MNPPAKQCPLIAAIVGTKCMISDGWFLLDYVLTREYQQPGQERIEGSYNSGERLGYIDMKNLTYLERSWDSELHLRSQALHSTWSK